MRKTCVLILLAGVLLTACGEDPTKLDYFQPTAKVTVTALETGEPIAGIKIMAVSGSTNTPVAGPFNTNADGKIDFGVEPYLFSNYLVFGGLNWQVHRIDPDYRKTTQTDKTPPVENPLTHITMRPAPAQDGLPRIAGTVIDAVTGKPLNQAIVSTAPDLSAYNEASLPGADVTTTNGTFTVHEVSFAEDFSTGNIIQVEWLFVSRVGYQPRRWRHEPDNGDDNLDISGVEIALTPLSANDTGVLTGRILVDGEPRSRVLIGLGGIVTDKGGMGVLGQTAITDSDGIYRFTGLATGTYTLQPGFVLYDQVTYIQSAYFDALEVISGQTTTARDLTVLWEIIPLDGNHESHAISSGAILFSWTPVPGAIEYRVHIEGDDTVLTQTNSLIWTIPAETKPGWYRWTVSAEKDNHHTIGVMQKVGWFELVE